MVATFKEKLHELNPSFITFEQLQTLQVNLGNRCNLSCTHCHVTASPDGERIMAWEVMEKIVQFLTGRPGITLDMTGGCPEMHPHFRQFVEATAGLSPRRMLRSNLTIMTEPGMAWLPAFCREQGLVIIASLPCYLEENVDRQRGSGVFARSIDALKHLNRLGYGDTLELNLVYNPGGAVLPPSQKGLEEAYRKELSKRFGIRFNTLYTITNAPVGRFRQFLEAPETYERYLSMLATRFNPATARTIMCRTLISVDWQGALYNCDFNQANGIPITGRDGQVLTVDDLDVASRPGTELILAQHCYCCTAGEGSSCTGSLA